MLKASLSFIVFFISLAIMISFSCEKGDPPSDPPPSGDTTEFMDWIINGVTYSYLETGPQSFSVIDAIDSIQPGTFSRSTKIDAQYFGSNIPYHSSFTFSHNQTTGIFPIDTSSIPSHRRIHISLGTSSTKLERIVSVAPKVTITKFGPVGGYIEGNFSLVAESLYSPGQYNVTCNFRVKR